MQALSTGTADTALKEKCALLQSALSELLPESGDYSIGIEGLALSRREKENLFQAEVCAVPHAAIVFQGAECVISNGRKYTCTRCECRFTSEDAFGTGHISDASAEASFPAISLRPDQALLKNLEESANKAAVCSSKLKPVALGAVGPDMLDAVFRLLMLHKKPAHIPYLAPLIIYDL